MADLCYVCFEQSAEAIRLQCRCYYCHDCVRHFLRDILKDQSLFPWRCCGRDVARDIAAPALTEALSRDWDARQEQHLANQRLVPKCAWEGCGVVLQDHHTSINTGFCHVCRRSTCMICRSKEHVWLACPLRKAEADEIAAMATRTGLQRCYQCRAIVERDEGCNHIV